MRLPAIGVAPAVFLLGCLSFLSAQPTQSTTAVTTVPRLVRISDTFHPATVLTVAPVESATFSIYKDQEGGSPLWQETQNVNLDSENHYSVLIGSTLNDGVPVDLFNSGETRWLGVRFNRPGETEQPRVQMVSVPYALKASDAETLGGLPAAAYLRAPTAAPGSTSTAAVSATATTTESTKPQPKVTSGTTNCIAVFTDSTDLGCSPMWQSSGSIGLGTTTPGSELDIQNSTAGFANFLNMKSNYTGGGVGAAGVTLSHQVSTMLMRAYSPGAPGNLQNSIGWFALSGSNKLLIGHAGAAAGNDVGFFTNNQWANPQMLLTNTGYLGINNATPSYPLDVVGQINANNPATSGTVYAVSGTVTSPNATAIFGTNSNTSGTGSPFGVGGTVTGSTGAGVGGLAVQAGAIGVYGLNNATSGYAVGVNGGTASNNGAGVNGNASQAGAFGVSGVNSATSGYAVGISGSTASNNGAGVQGSVNQAGATGVQGTNNASSGYAVGVGGSTFSTSGAGVEGSANLGASGVIGWNSATSGYGVGTEGISSSPGGVGVLASNRAFNGTLVPGTAAQFQTATTGILLQGTSGAAGANNYTATQVFLVDGYGNGTYAGNLQVNGNLNVTGSISKGSGSFKIDDPLDPANKYLSHSFVESPDMMNVYNGNITTDKHGLATVVLPDYFQALNRDFRYQLTVVGQFAQAIIARKIANHQFEIRTNKPNVEVSWQVTGIRQDAYANAHRIPTEEMKPPEEQGKYLHPELFGASQEQAIGFHRTQSEKAAADQTDTLQAVSGSAR